MAKNILVIDDERIVTRSLQRLLKKEGYDVVVAQSAQEAFERVKENDFDLIVSDVRMPGEDGIEIIQKIRAYLKENNKKPIPEVLITGYANEDKYKSAVELKVADYIYKPFDIKEFLEAVKRNLDVEK